MRPLDKVLFFWQSIEFGKLTKHYIAFVSLFLFKLALAIYETETKSTKLKKKNNSCKDLNYENTLDSPIQ